MPQTDILNPKQGFDKALGDTMNPSFGFTRKRAATGLNKKAVAGVPYSRELQNTGHSFSFSWLNRTYACVQRLKWYSEQYEDGFFTIIDWDGGARHFVGHFTTEINAVATANGKWDVQNVTFEEVPTVPMVEYPSDWDHDAISFGPINDYGDQKLATSGAWVLTANPVIDKDGDATTFQTMENAAGAAGDWAQYEYRGYGFRLWLKRGPTYGQCNIVVDGVQLAAAIDCYAAANMGPVMVLVQQAMPLDYHRVQVVCVGTRAAGLNGIGWAKLDVMR